MKIKERIFLINNLEMIFNQIDKNKNELKLVKSTLVVHYHKLLKFGKDIR